MYVSKLHFCLSSWCC